MNIEKAVNEVKGRLETVGEQAQDVAKVSFKAIKAANEVVLGGVQDLVKTHAEAAKDLYSLGKDSFDKAVSAGLLAVAKSPIEYLPDGRDTIVGAFNETVDLVTKTGEELVKVVKVGYEDVAAKITGKPAKRTKKHTRKAARKTNGAEATAQAAA